MWVFVLVIVLDALFAFIPANIAKSKGRSLGLWWLYGFFFWTIAVIHALVLKPIEELGVADGRGVAAANAVLMPGAVQPGVIAPSRSGVEVMCHSCGEFFPGNAKFCPFCGAETGGGSK